MAPSKDELRQHAKGLPPPTPAESDEVRRELSQWLTLRPCRTVLTYLPMGREIDLGPLVEAFPHLRWVTTRTPDLGWLTVHELPSTLEDHRFGFLQPTRAAPRVAPTDIDLALLPGVAFDPRGVRLGHGAGYYDELITRFQEDVELVGVTVERFVFQTIPQFAHDVPVRWLATEVGVRRSNSTG